MILLGELALLMLFSLWGRYPGWKRCLGSIFLAVTVAFVSYLYVPTFFSSAQKSPEVAFKTYLKQDVTSVVTVSNRSNRARWGNTVALFSVGWENPVFGVGRGFAHPYIVDHIPAFAANDREIKMWKRLLKEKGFMESGVPFLNTFGRMICEYGVLGLILFVVPFGVIGLRFLRNSKVVLRDFGNVCVLIALGGQVACLFSNTIFYTYPLCLSVVLLLMGRTLRERVAVHSGDNDFGESI